MMNKSPHTIRLVNSEKDFKEYYRVRYETLRKPWGQPEGSEKDETDSSSIHAFMLHGERAVAVCRLHFNNPSEGQIRYMGVDENERGKGLGADLVAWIENEAKERGARQMVLHARENAILFYEKQGYRVKEKSYLLFGEIQHWLMVKDIGPKK